MSLLVYVERDADFANFSINANSLDYMQILNINVNWEMHRKSGNSSQGLTHLML